jgi:hypothetical protein
VQSDGLAQPNGEMAAVVPGGGRRRQFWFLATDGGRSSEPRRGAAPFRSRRKVLPIQTSVPPNQVSAYHFANLGSRLFFSSPDRSLAEDS